MRSLTVLVLLFLVFLYLESHIAKIHLAVLEENRNAKTLKTAKRKSCIMQDFRSERTKNEFEVFRRELVGLRLFW